MPDAPEADIIANEFQEGVITTIPLDRLMLSTLNVRQTERAADVDSLAEDIAARGLKQNLVVVPAHFVSGEATDDQRTTMTTGPGGTGPWVNRFEVIAGGRRFQAMQMLVQQDRLSSTFPVPCMVEFRDEAAETSLSENLHRVAMNPADEFEAFRIIVEQAKQKGPAEDPIAYCAKRFGVTVKHVQGRLRLASLAPEILAALRHNEIGVESAKAYAGVENHALQLKVFEAQKKSNWQAHSPAAVRGALRDKTLSVNDGMVKFVGVDAYLTAGGRIEIEMFMGSEGQERLVDIKLLEKLAGETAEPLVAPQAKKDGFQSGLLAHGVSHSARWPKAPDGMQRYQGYYHAKPPTKAQLKKSVAVYAIAHDGGGLEKIGHFHTPPAAEPREERDWEAERAASVRQWRVDTKAAQMAVYDFGKFTGTALEGRAFWPAYQPRLVEDDPQDEDFAFVAIQIRVPKASIEAHRIEAERLIDEEAIPMHEVNHPGTVHMPAALRGSGARQHG
ncbi:ParB/RepB/Spo0J family partition protein [uncultured Novosphingobium sp.]|uniref:ParB/RepB/Spo0J family partition protein n=1 Tax=uncultured Novosphingobium sp. TaxID=292277 RepID=UPI00258C9309|nr:ParB/RepB/Spo0J family partition protein [uncultured Novosphingobium sp.]